MNAPNRTDSYMLPEGAQKVTYDKDTKIQNAGKFTILREDHTMGNLIRMYVSLAFSHSLYELLFMTKCWLCCMHVGSCCATRT